MDPKPNYIRYTFAASDLGISFNAGWNENHRPWSIENGRLKIGNDNYEIEVLNDSSLQISSAGFRRIKFVSEDYLKNDPEHLDSIGQFNGVTLFKANSFITPRYTRPESLTDAIQKDLNEGNKAAYFIMTFVVTKEGKLENAQVVSGVDKSFDKQAVKNLLKTSGSWTPAYFQGRPIQTLMKYDIQFLHFVGRMRPGD